MFDCVVINLDSQPARLARMAKRMAVLGISWRRFAAITPDRVTAKFEKQFAPTARACAQSHYEIWREMRDTNTPYTLICEDDVMFRKDAADIITRAVQTIHEQDPEWHALFLNHSDALAVHDVWQRIEHNTGTGAYILSQCAAAILLDRCVSGLSLADAMTGWWLQPLGHSYGYFPWLAIQEHHDSTIQTATHCEADRAKRDRLLTAANRSFCDYF